MNTQNIEYLLKELGCAGLNIGIVRTTTSPHHYDIVQHYINRYGYNSQLILKQGIRGTMVETFLEGMLACIDANMQIN